MPPDSVAARFQDGAELLEHYLDGGSLGGLFLPTFLPEILNLALGAPVQMVVRFDHEPSKVFRVLGRVLWKQHKAAGRRPSGLGVGFVPQDRTGRDKLLDFARGKKIQFIQRGSPRVLAKMRVSYLTADALIEDFTEDLSKGGLFIRTSEPLPVGTMVTLKLRPPGMLRAMVLHGRVTWHRKRAGERGMGIRLFYDDAEQREKMEGIIEKLALTSAQVP